jgi:hypothetical protein
MDRGPGLGYHLEVPARFSAAAQGIECVEAFRLLVLGAEPVPVKVEK